MGGDSIAVFTFGFEFVATDNTLFTEILDFPVGEDDLFTVMVEDMILGEFSPTDRVDFVSLLGKGVSRFKVTDIDRFIGDTVETYFPIQLAFDKNVGSFKMRPIVVDFAPLNPTYKYLCWVSLSSSHSIST